MHSRVPGHFCTTLWRIRNHHQLNFQITFCRDHDSILIVWIHNDSLLLVIDTAVCGDIGWNNFLAWLDGIAVGCSACWFSCGTLIDLLLRYMPSADASSAVSGRWIMGMSLSMKSITLFKGLGGSLRSITNVSLIRVCCSGLFRISLRLKTAHSAHLHKNAEAWGNLI